MLYLKWNELNKFTKNEKTNNSTTCSASNNVIIFCVCVYPNGVCLWATLTDQFTVVLQSVAQHRAILTFDTCYLFVKCAIFTRVCVCFCSVCANRNYLIYLNERNEKCAIGNANIGNEYGRRNKQGEELGISNNIVDL